MSVCYLYSKVDSDNTGVSTMIKLDATESVEYTRTVAVTKSTVFDGSSISDHALPDLPIVTFSGVTSFTKIRGSYPSPKEYRTMIDELIDGYELMKFHGTDDGVIPSLDSCYITSFSARRDAVHSDGMYVTITLQQMDISDSIATTTITTTASEGSTGTKSEDTAASLGEKKDSTTGTTTTILASAVTAVGSFVGSVFGTTD